MKSFNPVTLAACAAAGLAFVAAPNAADAQDYSYPWQSAYGDRATFHVTGPATTGDNAGDAILSSVEMPNGEVFTEYYRPTQITNFWFDGDGRKFTAEAGSNSTIGRNYSVDLGDANPDDGSTSSDTDADQAAMPAHILAVLENANLNNYVDTSTNNGWEFVIKFHLPLMDNDAEPDDFGEILYFERGDGGGNSWITFLAVDENNVPLEGAEPLAISPSETQLTTPHAVLANGQEMGITAIDISRLGVSQTSYLRVMRPQYGVGGYTSGENRADFKIMAVITHPSQLVSPGMYD